MDEILNKLDALSKKLSGEDRKLVRDVYGILLVHFAKPPEPDIEELNRIPIGENKELLHYYRYWK